MCRRKKEKKKRKKGAVCIITNALRAIGPTVLSLSFPPEKKFHVNVFFSFLLAPTFWYIIPQHKNKAAGGWVERTRIRVHVRRRAAPNDDADARLSLSSISLYLFDSF